MKTNELCTLEEYKKGFSAHYTDFGIMVYYNNEPFIQVATEEELHDVLKEYL
jgi:hypothetical protein